ncbi:MFS general substrate transporter [Fistulina hepatica ATCC 64428]|nr:MFS general substrate transporter [Fistulina hepatica ATCC 64428]
MTRADEETPLLLQHVQRTPLDWDQLSIVLFLQLAEPLTSQVIYPFSPQLIRDIGVTHGDETKVGYYVGLLQSLFFMTQALTVLNWSRLSDSIGRKPVILIGLSGLSLSMYCFGLSRTFWGLVLSRALNGALNGNIGVIKSMMAEMTDNTNIALAYSFMPLAWTLGGTLGPVIGGMLSRPADRFPSLFGNSAFHKEFPYFLPCAVPATFSALAWLIVYTRLRETVKSPMSIWQVLGLAPAKRPASPVEELPDAEKPLPFRAVLTRPVIIAGANYALLSLVEITFRAVQPVFFSTPLELGGLGLPPSTIGSILSVYGILNGVFQLGFFARIHDTFGTKRTFIFGIASAIPVFLSFPIISHLVKTQGVTPLVWAFVAIQIASSIVISLSYGAVFIFISDASPNRASLGATNGVCQMSVSIMRALGPAVSNTLLSLTMKHNWMGGYFVYFVLLIIVGVALFVASLLPSGHMRR